MSAIVAICHLSEWWATLESNQTWVSPRELQSP